MRDVSVRADMSRFLLVKGRVEPREITNSQG